MKVEGIKIGMRIFRVGNYPCFGTIIDMMIDSNVVFGNHLFVKMDNGEQFKIHAESINEVYCGDNVARFVTAHAYEEWCASELRRSYGAYVERQNAGKA